MSINDRSQMGGAGGSGGGKILATDQPNKTNSKGARRRREKADNARAPVSCGTEFPYSSDRT